MRNFKPFLKIFLLSASFLGSISAQAAQPLAEELDAFLAYVRENKIEQNMGLAGYEVAEWTAAFAKKLGTPEYEEGVRLIASRSEQSPEAIYWLLSHLQIKAEEDLARLYPDTNALNQGRNRVVKWTVGSNITLGTLAMVGQNSLPPYVRFLRAALPATGAWLGSVVGVEKNNSSSGMTGVPKTPLQLVSESDRFRVQNDSLYDYMSQSKDQNLLAHNYTAAAFAGLAFLTKDVALPMIRKFKVWRADPCSGFAVIQKAAVIKTRARRIGEAVAKFVVQGTALTVAYISLEEMIKNEIVAQAKDQLADKGQKYEVALHDLNRLSPSDRSLRALGKREGFKKSAADYLAVLSRVQADEPSRPIPAEVAPLSARYREYAEQDASSREIIKADLAKRLLAQITAEQALTHEKLFALFILGKLWEQNYYQTDEIESRLGDRFLMGQANAEGDQG